MELKYFYKRAGLWFYFQIGKYYLDKGWYEKRIAFDFFIFGCGFGFGKVFEEVKK